MTEVAFQWVKAQVGTAGIESADFLAKEAAGTPCAGPEPFLPVLSARANELLLGGLRKAPETGGTVCPPVN